MSDFKPFKTAVQKQFELMKKDSNKLFVVDVDKDKMWDLYLDSFPEGTNEVYRERREFDCSCCRSFVKHFGNIVAIKDNKLVSIWDITVPSPFDVVVKALSRLVKKSSIRDIFIAKEQDQGTDKNKELLDDESIKTWEHFYVKLPVSFVNRTSKSIESIQGAARDSKNVFQRSLNELTLDAGQTILELIDQESLYRGEEHKGSITEFIKAKKEYDKIPNNQKSNWCWLNSSTSHIARIRNTAIGTLLVDVSKSDCDLNVAVNRFEGVMAPTNYKRPKAIFTKKMIEDAESKINDLGYADSLTRRFAKLDDITVNNVLFLNRGTVKVGGSVFDNMKEEVGVNPKSFSRVDEVGIDDFIKNILPNAKSVELMVESRHQSNLVSLVAPQNKEASSMLKWNNNFSWSYSGDMTDSMKQRVKSLGGNVEGVLRFSIQWNDHGDNNNDFDAHCHEPKGNIIYFSHMHNQRTTGILDVDITDPFDQVTNGPAVENITWSDINKMQEGTYKFLVHNYSHNGGHSGFTAEIEYDGQIYSFAYSKELRNREKVLVAELTFSKRDGIKFIKSLDPSASSREIWGTKTNSFVKVSSLMFSPNYWDGQKGIGNKHYFFFIDGCVREDLPRGFYNEFLKDELTPHKRVFEALGSKMRVEADDNQLSGLGFSTTQRNSVIAKIEGSFSRTIKINI